MLDKIKQNPEPFIRVFVVLILIILFIIFSENDVKTTIIVLSLSFVIVIARLFIVLALGVLTYHLVIFLRRKQWYINSKELKFLTIGIIVSFLYYWL
jgi:hypothetical protein